MTYPTIVTQNRGPPVAHKEYYIVKNYNQGENYDEY